MEINFGYKLWLLVSGIFMILFGFWGLFLDPKSAFSVLAIVATFGVFTLSIFALYLAFALKSEGVNEWWILLLKSITYIIFGLLFIYFPVMTVHFVFTMLIVMLLLDIAYYIFLGARGIELVLGIIFMVVVSLLLLSPIFEIGLLIFFYVGIMLAYMINGAHRIMIGLRGERL